MKGRRIPIDAALKRPLFGLEQPGDYCGPVTGYTADQPAVFFLLPDDIGGGPYHCVSPPHVFTEEPDGTLTITASILSRGGSWHGYLTRGEWTEA